MTTPPDPLTVETRLRWEEQELAEGSSRKLYRLFAGKVWLGDVGPNWNGTWTVDTADDATTHPTEAEARAALIAAAMEDLQYVG